MIKLKRGINDLIRLQGNSASEIDKEIEQTYSSLCDDIASFCDDKEIANNIFTKINYLVYASKLYGGKRVAENFNNRIRNKMMD